MRKILESNGALVTFWFLVSLSLVWPNLQAQFAIIDDHETLRFLLLEPAKTVWDVLKGWPLSEWEHFGHEARVRPFYYLARHSEAFLWQYSVLPWYITRILFFFVTLWGSFTIFTRFFARKEALLFTFFLYSYRYVADIWSRLGVGESYGALGLVFYLLAFIPLWRGGREHKDWKLSLLLFVGGFMAIGSKENMVILILPSLGLFWRRRGCIASLGLIFLSLWMTSSVLLYSRNHPADVYGHSLSLIWRLKFFFGSLLGKRLPHIMFYTSGLLFLWRPKQFKKLFLAESCLMLLWASQSGFYPGFWPTHNRYDFPGMLVYPLTVIFFYQWGPQLVWIKRATLGLIFIYTVDRAIAMRGITALYQQAKLNAAITVDVMSKVKVMAKKIRANPEAAVLIRAHSPWDYEASWGLITFFEMLGVENDFFLQFDPRIERLVKTPQEKVIMRDFIPMREMGDKGFSPWSQWQKDQTVSRGCFEVSLSLPVTPSETHCEILGEINYGLLLDPNS